MEVSHLSRGDAMGLQLAVTDSLSPTLWNAAARKVKGRELHVHTYPAVVL